MYIQLNEFLICMDLCNYHSDQNTDFQPRWWAPYFPHRVPIPYHSLDFWHHSLVLPAFEFDVKEITQSVFFFSVWLPKFNTMSVKIILTLMSSSALFFLTVVLFPMVCIGPLSCLQLLLSSGRRLLVMCLGVSMAKPTICCCCCCCWVLLGGGKRYTTVNRITEE